jgi:tetratricopeptide (TPR) repeat protein
MQQITTGLTGKPEHDIKYLNEQLHIYQKHALSTEVLRGIGRMIYGILSDDQREEYNKIVINDYKAIRATIEEAHFQTVNKNYKRALEIIESLLPRIENEDGELLFYREDSVSQYFNFRNPLEKNLYIEIYKPQKEVRDMEEEYGVFYSVYGRLLFELKRYPESKRALIKAARIIPINVETIFELSEISKVHGAWQEYKNYTIQALEIAYSSASLSRCYRNLGYYFIEVHNIKAAIAAYYTSLQFEPNSAMTYGQLFYIQKHFRVPTPMPTRDEAEAILNAHDIQFGPNDIVLNLAAKLGRSLELARKYNMARFFYSILYDLTKDDKVKVLIDKLSNYIANQ